MVTASAFAEAAALCLAAINPDGSLGVVGFEADGWMTHEMSSAQLSGSPFEAYRRFGKIGHPPVILQKIQLQWSCMVMHQVPLSQDYQVSEQFYSDVIVQISSATEREAVSLDEYVVGFLTDGEEPATNAIIMSDGKDVTFSAGELFWPATER